MTEREKILARVREALKIPAPLPGLHREAHLPASAKTNSTPRQWLPKVGESFEEQLALFAKNAAELKADFQLLASRDELKTALAKISSAENWKRIASHRGELADSVSGALNLPIFFTDKNYDVHELETCDGGISECDALVAQTGSVLVTNRSAGGRALSVLPPHHVVLARREQLVADLPAAFELLQQKYAANYPSMISFITGPSRTGDIERILVLGAHGPKKLTILCFDKAGISSKRRLQLPTDSGKVANIMTEAAVSTPKKILVIDDNPIIQRAVYFALRDKGYKIFMSGEVSNALKIIRQEKPDLIVVDLSFPLDASNISGPLQDGFFVIERIRRTPGIEKVPILIVSGTEPEKYKDRAADAGVAACFHKPLNKEKLVATVQSILADDASTSQPPQT